MVVIHKKKGGKASKKVKHAGQENGKKGKKRGRYESDDSESDAFVSDQQSTTEDESDFATSDSDDFEEEEFSKITPKKKKGKDIKKALGKKGASLKKKSGPRPSKPASSLMDKEGFAPIKRKKQTD